MSDLSRRAFLGAIAAGVAAVSIPSVMSAPVLSEPSSIPLSHTHWAEPVFISNELRHWMTALQVHEHTEVATEQAKQNMAWAVEEHGLTVKNVQVFGPNHDVLAGGYKGTMYVVRGELVR